MKSTSTCITTYETDFPGFMVDMVVRPENEGEVSEAWLYHKDCTIKEYMFTCIGRDLVQFEQKLHSMLPSQVNSYIQDYLREEDYTALDVSEVVRKEKTIIFETNRPGLQIAATTFKEEGQHHLEVYGCMNGIYRLLLGEAVAEEKFTKEVIYFYINDLEEEIEIFYEEASQIEEEDCE